MNTLAFLRVILHRWWLIILVTSAAIAGAAAYSHHEQHIYQATSTVFAHPSKVVANPADFTSDLNLLSYGSMAQTFASLAESRSMLRGAARGLGLPPMAADGYTAVASMLPNTTVLDISVQGPDPNRVIRLANRLASDTSAATARYFRIFTLSTLDSAEGPSSLIRPQTSRNVLYGGLAGVIAGFILAVLSLHLPGMVAAATAAEPEKATAEPEAPQAASPHLPRSTEMPGDPVPVEATADQQHDLTMLKRPVIPNQSLWSSRPAGRKLGDDQRQADQGRQAR